MLDNNPEVAVAQCSGGFDKVLLAQTQELSAHHTGDVHPHSETDGDEDLPKALAEGEADGDDEQQGGYGPDHVDEEGEHVIDLAAVVAGGGAHEGADEEGDEDGEESDGEADAGADHQLAEHVTAVAVGAEEEPLLLDHPLGKVGFGIAFVIVLLEELRGHGVSSNGVSIYWNGLVFSGLSKQHLLEEIDVGNILFGFEFQELHGEAGFLEGDFELLVVAEGGGIGGDEIAEEGDNDNQPDVCQRHDGLAFLFETLPRERRQGDGALGFLLMSEQTHNRRQKYDFFKTGAPYATTNH